MHVVGPGAGPHAARHDHRCGDSHTSTHGAFGAIAFGIGTTPGARRARARRRWRMAPLKVRRIEVDGKLGPGVYAKDVILHIIRSSASTAAPASPTSTRATPSTRFSMEERMTVCNMSIEGGARVRLRQSRRDHLRVPEGPRPTRRKARPGSAPSRTGSRSRPMRTRATTTSCTSTPRTSRRAVTWGINPGQVDRDRRERAQRRRAVPATSEARASTRRSSTWSLTPAQPIKARRSTSPSSAAAPTAASRDFEEVAQARARASSVARRRARRWSCPGSQVVTQAAEAEGLDQVFTRRRLRVARGRLLDVPRR